MFQSMTGIEYVQRRSMLSRPTDDVVYRHDVIVPAMHNRGWRGHVLRRVLFKTRHVEGRRQQK